MREVLTPSSLGEAVAAVARRRATPLAGGTWIMRAALRDEHLADLYVSLSGIAELRAVEVGEREIAIGAAVNHTTLSAALRGVRGCAGLARAAEKAANPAVREAATVGGNLCAAGFAASDLAPALIAAAAEVELHDGDGVRRLPVEDFLAARQSLGGGRVLSRVFVPRAERLSAHARLPLRQAGDYPVAIVSMSLTGEAQSVRIAVGSVEPVARAWVGLSKALEGRPLNPDTAAEAARERLGEFKGRDGVEAPGWYRTEVLPGLVRAAFQSLQAAA